VDRGSADAFAQFSPAAFSIKLPVIVGAHGDGARRLRRVVDVDRLALIDGGARGAAQRIDGE
jgi:hypothetical protein